jgi:heme iron utilization protein
MAARDVIHFLFCAQLTSRSLFPALLPAESLNTDHGHALVLLAKAFSGIESQEVTMSSIDRLGFHVRLRTQDGMRGARIAFLREVSSPAEARQVLIEMIVQARRL